MHTGGVRILALISTALMCLFAPEKARAAVTPAAQFIWLSDLHFDPTADPTLVEALTQASVEDWPRLLSSSPPGRFSGYGQDVNWALLSSSLDAIRRAAPDVSFTVVTGDILVHRFREKFQRAAKSQDEQLFRRFATKTMQFMAEQLGTIAPGKPVLFTMGNNDSECGDYELQPHGAFLKDASPALAQMLGPLGDKVSAADWTALGSYSVPHPSLKHYRVISVNSVYFSPRYQNACSGGEADPAVEEMRWLGSKLAEAKNHKDKVWLIFHIPPGVDGYATARMKTGTSERTMFMWNPIYTEEFQKLLTQYRNTVTVSLAGHEHMDDFRLMSKSLVLMTPGLSPVVNQNPAFRVVSFRQDGTLSDASTYYLSNLDAALNGAAPEWKLEYGFANAWRLPRLDFKHFSKLYREIEAEPEVRDRWSKLYSVSHSQPNAATKQALPELLCASGKVTEASFKACVERIRSELPER